MTARKGQPTPSPDPVDAPATVETAQPTRPSAVVSVQAALAAVIRDMPAIGKANTAPGNMGGFAYRGVEQFTSAVQPLLARHGVVIVPQVRSIDFRAAPGQKEAWQDVVMIVDWQIVGPDGSTLQATTTGIGRDHTDKGANKAQTQAFKYLLMHLLCVADSKDDADGHDYTRAAADEPSPMAQRDPADVTYERLAAAANIPGARERIKAFGAEHGKGFSGNDLRADRTWMTKVNGLLDRIEAEHAQDVDAERAPARQLDADRPGSSGETRTDADATATADVQHRLTEAGIGSEVVDTGEADGVDANASTPSTEATTTGTPSEVEQAAAAQADDVEPSPAWTTCAYEASGEERDAHLAATGKYVGGPCFLPKGHDGDHDYEEPF